MTLPTLQKDDIEKLDNLLSFLKDNKDSYILVDVYCKQQWGENDHLYNSFASCLKDNGLTTAKNDSDLSQMITQRGLRLKSFKSEYSKSKTDSFIKNFNKYFEFLSKPVLALIAVLGFLFGVYKQFAVNKYEATKDQQKMTIDSLTKVVQSLRQDSINIHPIQKDKLQKADTTIKGH